MGIDAERFDDRLHAGGIANPALAENEAARIVANEANGRCRFDRRVLRWGSPPDDPRDGYRQSNRHTDGRWHQPTPHHVEINTGYRRPFL